MKKINALFSAGMKKATIPVVAAASFAASSAYAVEDNAVTTAIKTAISNGTANYGTVTVGVITMAALGFGVAMIVGWLKK